MLQKGAAIVQLTLITWILLLDGGASSRKYDILLLWKILRKLNTISFLQALINFLDE